jgi:hypothetical protein
VFQSFISLYVIVRLPQNILKRCGKPPMFRELARAGHSMSHVTHRGPLPLLSTENGPITGVLDAQLIPKCIVCFPVKFGLTQLPPGRSGVRDIGFVLIRPSDVLDGLKNWKVA